MKYFYAKTVNGSWFVCSMDDPNSETVNLHGVFADKGEAKALWRQLRKTEG